MRNHSGFTLIELLIVIVIVGILAAIAIPKFNSVRDKGYLAAAKADLRNLANQQEVYYNEAHTYSGDLDVVGMVESDGVVIDITEADNQGWSATAYHQGLVAETCAIYHGYAAQVAPATVESVVQCSS